MQKEFPHAELSIVEVNGCPTQSRITLIRVDKINESGFSFASALRFPVNPLVTLNLRLSFQDETIDLQGTINGSQFEGNSNRFHIIFNNNKQVKSKLTRMLRNFTKQYEILRLRADHYYNYNMEEAYSLKNNQINICM
ncbi:hypothetical protein EHS13_08420 [Paenibacillus psychroresistens]|uniref:PilZ domain-containing protein n=1 Tax=Paenibacillus psychroresistens TaxID=1778678 RepID=A0A6B8RFK7_9BACL|nr:hypothetical protein [Paenibacillus psychroresistens]QGQ94899.1 hypothetical protein EHS13_08420 [Paenibacillus psychroresistens]